ncbi:MAG TPA: hypothetical protein VNK82_03825 [Terriglobales bacterium]|nr:hypothetical protein [Terriglobales bacterium]
MPGKKPQYRVISPRGDEVHLEQALAEAWDDGYELAFVVPNSGPRGINVFLILKLRGKQ